VESFWLSWIAAAGWSRPTDKRVNVKSQITYRLLMLGGAALLLVPAHGYAGPLRLWLVTRREGWVCTGLILWGLGFSWWARIHLGDLWSGRITKKSEHRVIDSGPYAIVRHPIYTGLLLAVYATAVAKGTVPGVLGALVVTIGVWMKARVEEVWLRNELTEDAYASYARRVPMLIPLGPKGDR